MAIPNLRAIRDWCNERFALLDNVGDIAKSMVIDGVQYYLDYQDDKWGVNTNPARGADTFVPFPVNDGTIVDPGVPGEPELLRFKIDTNETKVNSVCTFQPNFYFPIQDVGMIKKMTIASLSLQAYRSSSSLPANNFFFRIYGTKSGEATSSPVYQIYAASPNYNMARDVEIDLAGLASIDYAQFRFSSNSSNLSISYYYALRGTCEINVLIK